MRDGLSHTNSSANQVPASRWGRWIRGFGTDFLGVLAIFFIYAGERVPGVNEPHYWTKAVHFWDPSFGAGDLFLESGNAHWLFYVTLGSLVRWFPWITAIWIARFALWIALAWGWTWMIRSLFDEHVVSDRASGGLTGTKTGASATPWIATLCGGVWLACMHWGHWAGEWVVGGAEAKVGAYALVFAGLGCFFRRRWRCGWLLLGLASALHVVAGGWVLLVSIVTSWILFDAGPDRFRRWASVHVGPVLVACLLAIVGAVPALWSDWGAPSEVTTQAAVIQVYGRLGHHLAPTLFSTLRWQSFGILVLIGVLVFWFVRQCESPTESRSGKSNSEPILFLGDGSWMDGWPFGLRWIVVNAGVALGVAVLGLGIDWILGGIDRNLSARVLKYYWFRWNDVSFPLAITAALGCIASGRLVYVRERTTAQINAICILVCVGAGMLGTRFFENSNAWIPFGDRARLLSKWDDEFAQRDQYRDWLDVCDWIRENTDREGLWLTPRNQQTFKWHAHRAELAATKDMPQDAVSILEWSKRLEDAYKLNEDKMQLPWTTQQLWELQSKYGLRYVLLDQRVVGQGPPLLPIVYPPPGVADASFSVFEFPSEPILDSAREPASSEAGSFRVPPGQ